MMFLLETISMQNSVAVARKFEQYAAYLNSVRHKMPRDAYEFASSSWHYNPEDHRCPHDSWLQHLTVNEPSVGTRSESRHITISVRLLGAYHDGWIDLTYTGVKSYSLGLAQADRTVGVGHGDWLIDELRLSDDGLVIHEIIFSTGAHWLINSDDVQYRWTTSKGQ